MNADRIYAIINLVFLLDRVTVRCIMYNRIINGLIHYRKLKSNILIDAYKNSESIIADTHHERICFYSPNRATPIQFDVPHYYSVKTKVAAPIKMHFVYAYF